MVPGDFRRASLRAFGIAGLAVPAARTRPIVLDAHAMGVKVLSYDRLIADADVDRYLSFDNGKVRGRRSSWG